jgi:N6-L-threonylcarbamoyladenine synthase
MEALCNFDLRKVDAIAVTTGPGLIGSLLVGVETAKTLSYVFDIKLIPVNHLIAHIYANWLNTGDNHDIPQFPIVALVVSGGHTELVYLEDHNNIKWLGGTRDDAAGEAFDKTARVLGLGYPGGPEIANKAVLYFQKHDGDNISLKKFPRPLSNSNEIDFSFSGLKTSVINDVKNKELSKNDIEVLSAEIQEAIVDSLIEKSLLAIQIYKPTSFLVAGGVSANEKLKEKMQIELKKTDSKLYIPPPELCTDNASYIASRAYFSQNAISYKTLTANPQLSITQSPF